MKFVAGAHAQTAKEPRTESERFTARERAFAACGLGREPVTHTRPQASAANDDQWLPSVVEAVGQRTDTDGFDPGANACVPRAKRQENAERPRTRRERPPVVILERRYECYVVDLGLSVVTAGQPRIRGIGVRENERAVRRLELPATLAKTERRLPALS